MTQGFEPTKPRGPVAAMYASPGPVYNLPSMTGTNQHDPRSRARKGPAWFFGVRHGKLKDECSPGPASVLPDMRVTRTGRDGTFIYSLYARPKSMKPSSNPGPGSYFPEHAGPSAAPASPRYSFGSRTRLRSSDTNPAPNSYTLPGLIGATSTSKFHQSPIWSQYGRTKNPAVDAVAGSSPANTGPGSHNVTDVAVYRSRGPSYTLKPRLEMVGDSTSKPGPGAHCPERVLLTRRSAPSYSFGMRHSNYIAPLITDH